MGAWASVSHILPFLETRASNVLAYALSYPPKGVSLLSRFFPLPSVTVTFFSLHQTQSCSPLIHQTNHVTKPCRTPFKLLDPLLRHIKQNLPFQGSL